MEYVMSDLLVKARDGRYGIPAIDTFDMVSVLSCFLAAEKEKSPVIIMTCGYELEYLHITYADFARLVRAIAVRFPDVPYSIHLDHGTEEECCAALEGGFPSVMYDGSFGPYEDNVAVTAKLKKAAGEERCVEAEVGRVGGEEGKGMTAESTIIESDPDELVDFLSRTGADTIAVSIGNIHGVHGFVKRAPKLNFELLKELRGKCGVPLVLHGASDIPEEDIKKAVSLGISKINYYSQLFRAFMQSVKQNVDLTAEECLGKGIDVLTEEISKLMQMTGSSGKA